MSRLAGAFGEAFDDAEEVEGFGGEAGSLEFAPFPDMRLACKGSLEGRLADMMPPFTSNVGISDSQQAQCQLQIMS